MISPGRLWWLLRRDLRRGWGATRHHYRTLPKITGWKAPFPEEPPQPVPVHLLTGKDDWQLAAWMLASWFHFSEANWRVVIHDDGTLPEAAARSLREMFPQVRLIPRKEADAELAKVLKPFPFCTEYRDMHPLALKVFDIPHYAKSDHYLAFDSDLLFFTYPREIMDWVHARRAECWFNADVADSTLITPDEAEAELEVKLWPKVNSGLCLIYTPAIDFDFCDRALAQTGILRGHIWRVEQTLYALCASRHGKGGLLSQHYEVSLRRRSSPGAVARHYVGAVRNRFYAEGLSRLKDLLPAPE
jgi:hypothetical protein